jgi:hypothetical protein
MIFAYLDPGSGSMILQAVIGGLAGVGVAFKAYRARRAANRAGNPAGEGEAAASDAEDAEPVVES